MLLAALVVFSGAPAALATTSNSTNYQATELQFGAGSTLESCSDQFCTQASIGNMSAETSTNGTSSATFSTVAGDEPLLEVIVEPGESNLGVLTTEHTATKTTTLRIRNYLSNGYTLQVIGTPPKYADHTLATPSTPTAAAPGTEQFAINLAANTSPNVGSGPVQVPSDQTSFGVVESGYGTPNLFKYVSGEVVARSQSESGRTDYTISMIVNISNATPAGHYTGDFSAVVVPVY